MRKLAVIALGGNALLRDNQKGTIEEQEQNTTETLENLIFLIKRGYDLVITHGNGPQVGNIIMRNDAGEQLYDLAQMPLDVCVADSQGGIGYMIERCLRNVLKKHALHKEVISLITQVVVDKDDEAFSHPRKRIGKIMTEAEATKLNQTKKWIFKPASKRSGGWRRVVPSPKPIEILNENEIAAIARKGTIVIAAGGGGIPVYRDDQECLTPVEAVVDKDLASSLLASHIHADEFYVLTDVAFVYTNFGTPQQQKMEFLNYRDTLWHLKRGTFGEGSMAPKIRAALQFIESGGSKSIITESKKLKDTSYGTKITMEYDVSDTQRKGFTEPPCHMNSPSS